jgi:hypothetical protein
MKVSSKKLAIGLFLLITLCAPMAFVAYRFATFKIFPDPPPPIPFDSAAWKRESSSDFHDNTRAAMLDDLLSRYDFKGWDRARLEAVLGVADDFNLQSNLEGPPAIWDIGYHAGTDWIDYRVLVFDLDDEGLVREYSIDLY